MNAAFVPCLLLIISPIVLILIVRVMGAMLRLMTGGAHESDSALPPWNQGQTASDSAESGPPLGREPESDIPERQVTESVCPNPKCRKANRPEATYCCRCGSTLT